jgi:hypothetical protein
MTSKDSDERVRVAAEFVARVADFENIRRVADAMTEAERRKLEAIAPALWNFDPRRPSGEGRRG